MTELLVLESNCDEAVTQITQTLTSKGLWVVCSFNLRTSSHLVRDVSDLGGLRTADSFDLPSILTMPTGCVCPHHGTDPCDCQMVVMLVYDIVDSPATLVAHGHNGNTWLTLIDTPEQHPASDLVQAIFEALSVDLLPI